MSAMHAAWGARPNGRTRPARLRFLIIVGILVSAISWSTSAQTIGVDWKFFGGAVITGRSVATFYDASGVVRRPDGHVEVWTKGLWDSDITRAQKSKANKGYIERVATKLVSGYVPPYAAVAEVDQDLKINILTYEDSANTAQINPMLRMLFEFDCAARLDRRLSLWSSIGNQQSSNDRPGEWEHVAPETNVDTLMKLLCQRR